MWYDYLLDNDNRGCNILFGQRYKAGGTQGCLIANACIFLELRANHSDQQATSSKPPAALLSGLALAIKKLEIAQTF